MSGGVIVCPSCRRESPDTAAFCAGCGVSLGASAEPATEERKVVTILFADLVGSTAAAERRDPEDVRKTLSAYYARLRTELERHGGTVEKFIGDAVMAVFGAPIAHEDDPERAVRAALAIRDALGESDVDVRIAVHTGEALVSRGARVAAGEAMVAGDVVNTAARLQTAAPVNGVLVGETTYRATDHAIEYEDAGAVLARGKSEPVPAWLALQAKARFGVDVDQRPLGELVGRADEVAVLDGALARVRRERDPQLVTLVGVPGIGKSRLVAELLARVDALPDLIHWRQGRCLPYGEGVSFWALGEMAKAQAGVLESDPAAVAEEKLAAAVAVLVADPDEAAWVLGHMRPLVGLGGSGAGADDRRSEALTAWRRFFEGLAEQRPTVLVFEDLHWADEGLLDFVDHLVDWARGVPLLVVATARPEILERRPGWGGGKANATTLSLSPLSDVETARLVGLLLEQSVLAADVQSELLRRAGGNPLYAEEYVRMMRDGRFSAEDLPENVQGIIAARLDALPPEEKLLLQDAAVVGKVFWSGALAAVGDAPRWTVEERLHALERKEFIRRERRSSVASETEYAFRHVLVRDVAYAQIPRAGRADKHRLAAEWIDSLGSGRSEDRSEMLAHHYGAALEFARASDQPTTQLEEHARVAFRDAGERAFALGAWTAALQFFTRALELWPEDDPEWPLVALRQGRTDHDVRQQGDPQPHVERALGLLLEGGDLDRAAEAEVLLAERDWFAGRSDSTFIRLERARALVADRPASVSKAKTYAELSRFLMLADRNREAADVGREALALARELGVRELQAHVLNNIGTARATGGDLGGFADLEEAFSIADSINSPEALRARGNHASLLGNQGELLRAHALYEDVIAHAGRLGIRGFESWCSVELAFLDYHGGAWDDAYGASEAFLAEGGDAHYMGAMARQVTGAIMVARGDADAGLAESERALVFARHAKDPQILYPTLSWHLHLLTLGDRTTEAGERADELLRLAAEHEYQPNQWVMHATFALDDLNRASDAAGVLSRLTTTTRWREAAMTYAAGDRIAAADVLGAMNDRAGEAYARLRAAEDGASREQANASLAFYRGVRASVFARRAEALLPASA